MAASAAAALATAGGCGGDASGPLEVSLSQLVTKPDLYEGDVVRASGMLREAKGSLELADEAGYSVLLRSDAAPRGALGESVTVEGPFGRDLSSRPFIAAETIAPTGR